ncbi:MAG: MotA/TolQ/ExbB proton channel family protein [Alphaproteobacteria bacterium]|nr:MotA/TolQ/ExbB proton channel family protein [Alphaproteobacteria bacterium]
MKQKQKTLRKSEYANNKKWYWTIGTALVFGLLMVIMKANTVTIFVTTVFCAGIGGLFGYDLTKHTYNKSWYPTIGMLGTFVGIFIGLYDLDISNVNEVTASLSELLSGLKLAFITSIVGLIFSILRKACDSFGWNKIEELDTDKVLQSIDENTKHIDLNTAIVDELVALRAEFKKFAVKVSETAAIQFSSALNEVASDLNNKLSEQFGSNFKAFAGSVDKLVDWQAKNKEYMEKYTKYLTDYTNTYNEKLELLANSASSVEKIILQTQQHIDALSTSLKELDLLGEEAHKFIPEIKSVIAEAETEIKTISDMSQAVVTSVQEITTSSEEELQKLHVEIREVVIENLKDTSTKLVDEIKDISKKNIDEVQKVATNTAAVVDNMAKTFAEESVTKLQGVVGRMDKQLGEAGGYIAGALSKMGDDLYELHNKLEDQKKQTENLKQETKKTSKKGK